MEGWEFDTDNYHRQIVNDDICVILLLVISSVCRSIVSDFSWVCEEAWVPTLSQAMFFVGKLSNPMEKLKGGDPKPWKKEPPKRNEKGGG